ncbi:sce7726 family protein [Leucobacter aridicollis]|uniref:sce7726 family protein n=1 Tax=Leucobacter aridicollis TaxID=283878 RepID=UPI0035B57CB6
MRDLDVRCSLHELLREQHSAEAESTRIVDEFEIAGSARVDTIVLNGSFSGFEIKSERDTLRRLPHQVEVYSQVLDFATLVVAKSHLKKARPLLPYWWGIIEATSGPEGVQLRQVKKARLNRVVDPIVLSTLLWRAEVLEELDARDAAGGVRSKPNWFLWERLASTIPPRELRAVVREKLKARSGWRVPSQ